MCKIVRVLIGKNLCLEIRQAEKEVDEPMKWKIRSDFK